MKSRFCNVAVSLSFFVLVTANQPLLGCSGTGAGSITDIPLLGGSGFQVDAINQAGQMTGFAYLPGDTAAHAFLYGNGAITDLGSFGGNVSEGLSINASGQIVGYASFANGDSHAFLYNGALNDILSASYSSATAINDAGQITGSMQDENGDLTAFLYANGSALNLGSFGGGYSAPYAMNQQGVVAGEAETSVFDIHAFVYANGAMNDLGTLGGFYSAAFAINEANAVAGEAETTNFDIHAFIYANGTMTDLGTLGGYYSTPRAINNSGQVIGIATTTNDSTTHGFIYLGGVLTDMGSLAGNYSEAEGENNTGQVVGFSITSSGQSHAVLWQNGTLTDLNDALPANSGWELVDAQLINDSGIIVGFGYHNGQYQWFAMTVGAANQPPIAQAGPDQTVDCPSSVSLDGSHSSDPDGDTLSYQWSEGSLILGTTAALSVSLPLGDHNLVLTATDPCGVSAYTNVTVHVVDVSAPTILSAATPITVGTDADCQAAVPNLVPNVVAADACTPAAQLTITQNPAAGTRLSVGQHSIGITVADASGNQATQQVSFNVVDTTPPAILSAATPVTVGTDANCRAAVPNLVPNVVATDACTPVAQLTITQNPAAGTLLSPGQYNITITVADASDNQATQQISFNVVDTTPPAILSAATPITVAADANCQAAVPNLVPNVAATDACTPAAQLTITQNPAAGTLLSPGQHSITITVADASGNQATQQISFTVVDATPPVILSVATPITISANANCQAAVPNLVPNVVATDACTPAAQLAITQNPAAGTFLSPGEYSITITVADVSGNKATQQISFTVADTTPPTIVSLPAAITVPAGSDCQGTVPNLVPNVVANDACTPAAQLSITQNPAAGTVLAPGQYTITFTVTDGSGNAATQQVSFTITAAGGAPAIQSITATPNVLSPPNHQMVPVALSVATTGSCGSALVTRIISITCNEASAPGDAVITGNLTANLAATRNPSGGGRVYTLVVECTNASGQHATGTVTVSVPKGNGSGNGNKP